MHFFLHNMHPITWQQIVYAEYTNCSSREHIVYGAHCGSTMHIYKHMSALTYTTYDVESESE